MSNWKEYIYVNPRNRVLREAIVKGDKDEETSDISVAFIEADKDNNLGMSRIEIDRDTGYEQWQSTADGAYLKNWLKDNKKHFEDKGFKIDDKTVQGNRMIFHKK